MDFFFFFFKPEAHLNVSWWDGEGLSIRFFSSNEKGVGRMEADQALLKEPG